MFGAILAPGQRGIARHLLCQGGSLVPGQDVFVFHRIARGDGRALSVSSGSKTEMLKLLASPGRQQLLFLN